MKNNSMSIPHSPSELTHQMSGLARLLIIESGSQDACGRVTENIPLPHWDDGENYEYTVNTIHET